MKLSKYLSILVLIILTVNITASCQTLKKNDNVTDTQSLRLFRQIFWDSLPQPVGFINDYENIYSDQEKKTLDSLIRDFEKRTTIQIALITFDTTMTTADSLDALTLRLAKFWGVGQKDKNNGVAIGISRGYRRIRIENGYGIEKIMTDAQTKQIIETAFIPSFREGKYYEGTFNGLKVLMAKLKELYQ